MQSLSFFPLALCAGLLSLSNCTSDYVTSTTAAPATPPVGASPDTATKPSVGEGSAAVYECPMGCRDSRRTVPGKCPKCKMDVVKKS